MSHATSAIRWTAPECLDTSSFSSLGRHQQLPADIWALGLIIYTVRLSLINPIVAHLIILVQVLSGLAPYHSMRSAWAVCQAISAGEHPAIPAAWGELFGGRGITIVYMMRKCWDTDCTKRPKAETLLRMM
ncbi:hypothetical protein CALCODRAFT_34485 [Calocera cornea HHB12733]|uniref:Protein kinase domain-containing protein n=1 Tax=Calocera cornea HHB12733 TaxID=1353952 RepID=A0A165E1L8_9BASI|nr:hypothetical protein CALCODRAFT_34485 [Calocera cornea HHB12733]